MCRWEQCVIFSFFDIFIFVSYVLFVIWQGRAFFAVVNDRKSWTTYAFVSDDVQVVKDATAAAYKPGVSGCMPPPSKQAVERSFLSSRFPQQSILTPSTANPFHK